MANRIVNAIASAHEAKIIQSSALNDEPVRTGIRATSLAATNMLAITARGMEMFRNDADSSLTGQAQVVAVTFSVTV